MSELVIKLPEGVEQYRHDIRRFVDAMVYKLNVHRNKGRWENVGAATALNKLHGEFGELQAALSGGNLIEILTEAADVANYAMIVASISTERGE